MEEIAKSPPSTTSVGHKRAGKHLPSSLPSVSLLTFHARERESRGEEELKNNTPQVLTCNEYQREVAVSQNIACKHIDRVFTFNKKEMTIQELTFRVLSVMSKLPSRSVQLFAGRALL
ncbi:hypothetical protein Vadar_024855 [Vaccinium darrowii]|uniref:Uncharacterized protein n=1 Tax=Vaccinium darrowii TaxID=229202 RepID=A0ACB7ZF21_9ERIC|nr:hypothetical protein Vadar_024855 [Vaccinium darrowii]